MSVVVILVVVIKVLAEVVIKVVVEVVLKCQNGRSSKGSELLAF